MCISKTVSHGKQPGSEGVTGKKKKKEEEINDFQLRQNIE